MGFGGLKSGAAGVLTAADYASLPPLARDGAVAVTLDTDSLWVFDAGTTTWVAAGGGGGTGSEDFPKLITTVQLGVPSSPITAGSTYTYTVPLGDTYDEVFLTNFQWITVNTFDTAQPGGTLGRGSFDSANVGPILSVNQGSASWIRVFRLNYPEFFGATQVTGKVFDGAPDTTVVLGHGLNDKDVTFDHPDLFGTPPKKFAILDAWLNGTDLKITVKNYDVTTIELAIYIGVERVYGYRGETKWSTVADQFYAVCGDRANEDFWISEDGGESFLNYPSLPGSTVNGIASHDAAGFFVALLDYEFRAFTANSPTYTWSEVGTFTLPYGNTPGTYRLNAGDDYQGQPYGGHPLDYEDGISAFFAFENYTSRGRLFKSVDALVSIGDNDPTYDDGDPVFKAEDELADIDLFSSSSDARNYPQSVPIYVKAIDDQNLFVSFAYKAATVAQIVEVVCLGDVAAVAEEREVTCIDDVSGSVANTWFYLYAPGDSPSVIVWFNMDGGGEQPDLGEGYIYAEVSYSENDTAATIATATATIVNALDDFSASDAGDVVTIINDNVGSCSDASDENTGFSFNTTQQGVDAVDLTGKHFKVYSGQDINRYVVWYKVDGLGDEPDLGGEYAYEEVDISLGDSAAVVAMATKTVLDTLVADFTVGISSATLTITNLLKGDTANVEDGDSGFSTSTTTNGATIWRMAFFKTTDGGASWVEILGASPDFKDSSGRLIGISDDGTKIMALVQGYAAPNTGSNYPYDPQEMRFNQSFDSGATWDEPDGSWILAFAGYGSGIINEGILGMFTSGAQIIAIIAGTDGAPAVIRSEDSGATWDDEQKLAPWNYRKAEPNQRGLGSDAIDDFLSFTSYGYVANDATSYAYRGRLIDTFTNWKAWGI